MSDRVSTDRNLLFGILALQMDFISRDALVGTMNAWVIQKNKPLGDVLVERGELAKAHRDLLEGLVDEHVRAHAGDAARSLHAISSAGDIADDLQHIVDEQVQASLGHVRRIASLTQDYSGVAATVLPRVGPQTFWTGRFRIVRPHAKGGLGIVSIAMDDELDREVAFKEIKHEFAEHQTSRARFVLEAEITGKLEHPGIVPIYGLGHAPDGSPYYAMRFIRGDSLADAINRFHDPAGPFIDPVKRSLQLRELLSRFLDVCDAMAYAHSRGVLHRDLKPGNVMLGPFGETLVVDWGLALHSNACPRDTTRRTARSNRPKPIPAPCPMKKVRSSAPWHTCRRTGGRESRQTRASLRCLWSGRDSLRLADGKVPQHGRQSGRASQIHSRRKYHPAARLP